MFDDIDYLMAMDSRTIADFRDGSPGDLEGRRFRLTGEDYDALFGVAAFDWEGEWFIERCETEGSDWHIVAVPVSVTVEPYYAWQDILTERWAVKLGLKVIEDLEGANHVFVLEHLRQGFAFSAISHCETEPPLFQGETREHRALVSVR